MQLELSVQARRDIIALHRAGVERFGARLAAHHTSGLFNLLDLLTTNPQMARVHSRFRNNMRVLRYESHVIIYRIVEDVIRVVRILHGKQNWTDHI